MESLVKQRLQELKVALDNASNAMDAMGWHQLASALRKGDATAHFKPIEVKKS